MITGGVMKIGKLFLSGFVVLVVACVLNVNTAFAQYGPSATARPYQGKFISYNDVDNTMTVSLHGTGSKAEIKAVVSLDSVGEILLDGQDAVIEDLELLNMLRAFDGTKTIDPETGEVTIMGTTYIHAVTPRE